MSKILVLGAGLVGTPMALDLMKDEGNQLSVADLSSEKIALIQDKFGINGIQADLSIKGEIERLVSDFDFVINAVPGFMGYEALKSIINAGKNVVDIAFSPEDLTELHDLAIEKDVTALVDFGVAPGLSHLMVAHASEVFDELDYVRIFVGGLPFRRTKPFEYAAVFSPIDVIEEYTRPARLVENGEVVVKEALSEIELLEFERVGTLEAFNSDGLRSLVNSISAKDMAEKTLRYPGHAQLMKIFRDTGFFGTENIEVKGQKVTPMDLTAELLFPKWQMKENDSDLTVMKVIAEGPVQGKRQRFEFDLYDEFDMESNIHSMARTTGYTATMGIRLLQEGLFSQKGVFYPEVLGKDHKSIGFILEGLQKRGIRLSMSMNDII